MCNLIKYAPHLATTRLAGLDGLRGIAIIAVLLFHADFYWVKGGYLGVDLFFVISGFLITGLLVNEIQVSGRLDLVQFYWRRAKRLLPAVWLMMVSITVAAAWFAVDALPRLRGDVVASFVSFTNWELLRTHTSYFEAIGRPPLLQHLWSLAIEVQFYIVWSALVLVGLPRIGRRGMTFMTVVLAVVSMAWMAVLVMKMGYPGQGDPSRLYFGTDTHGFPLLLGAALGLVWQPGHAIQSSRSVARQIIFLLGLITLAVLFMLFSCLGEANVLLYPWGFLLVAMISIILVVVVTHPGAAFGHWLDSAPLRWIGERSYGIYLWHWPVFMLTRPGIDLRTWDANTILILRITLTIGIAALSYRYVEEPIRRGALERIWRGMSVATTRRSALLLGVMLMSILLLTVGVTGAILMQAPSQVKSAQDMREAFELDIASQVKNQNKVDSVMSAIEAPIPVEATDIPIQPEQSFVETSTGQELTAVGDSVLLGSSYLFKATLPGVDVHAKTSWQAADMIKQLKMLRDTDRLRPVVLVHLGTNGYVTEDQLRQILSMLTDRKRVILVDAHVPRRWMKANNALLKRVVPDFSNTVRVCWSNVSAGQPNYFISDGVHLTRRGQRAFIAEIIRVGQLTPDTSETPDATSINPS